MRSNKKGQAQAFRSSRSRQAVLAVLFSMNTTPRRRASVQSTAWSPTRPVPPSPALQVIYRTPKSITAKGSRASLVGVTEVRLMSTQISMAQCAGGDSPSENCLEHVHPMLLWQSRTGLMRMPLLHFAVFFRAVAAGAPHVRSQPRSLPDRRPVAAAVPASGVSLTTTARLNVWRK